MNILSVNSVSRKFGNEIAVDNISFNIKKGEIYGLIGPNGAGKTTLINMITGILKPDVGEIKIGEYEISKDPNKAKKLLGLAPQELALIEAVSAIDNLEYFASLYGLTGKYKNERINEALDLSGLREKNKKKVKTYSGGMKRRLNMAIAVLHEPELLILDEPTVGIDAQSRNHIFEFIRRMNSEKNMAVLYTSHYMEEVEQLCKNILIMDLGKEVAKGDKEEIKSMISDGNNIVLNIINADNKLLDIASTTPGVLNAELNLNELKIVIEKSKFVLSPLIIKMEKEGYVIRDYKLDEPSLEELFLSITGKNLRD